MAPKALAGVSRCVWDEKDVDEITQIELACYFSFIDPRFS